MFAYICSLKAYKMKNTYLLFALLFISTITWSQKKEKIKASKIVTVSQKEIENFDSIEVQDEIDVFLVKGSSCAIEIEADDNTHDVFDFKLSGGILRIGLTHDISGAKKTSLRITYTDEFKMLVAKGESDITALAEVKLNDITFKCYDESRLFLNANCKNFTLIANDKSKVEINLKAEDAVVELSKNTNIKALISAVNLKCDMYQKSIAVVEGDCIDFKLRMDNYAEFNGKKLTTKTSSLIVEADSKNSINATSNLILEASGKAETNFYGNGKVDLKKFTDQAILFKKIDK